jgi:hypothetical protein
MLRPRSTLTLLKNESEKLKPFQNPSRGAGLWGRLASRGLSKNDIIHIHFAFSALVTHPRARAATRQAAASEKSISKKASSKKIKMQPKKVAIAKQKPTRLRAALEAQRRLGRVTRRDAPRF